MKALDKEMKRLMRKRDKMEKRAARLQAIVYGIRDDIAVVEMELSALEEERIARNDSTS